MAYKNNLKEYLTIEETNNDKCFIYRLFYLQARYYHLSNVKHETSSFFEEFIESDSYSKKDPQEMDIVEMRDYVKKNYVCASYIDKAKLINDLNIFKTYRDNIMIDIETDKMFSDLLTNIITIFSITIAVAVGYLSVSNEVSDILGLKESFYRDNYNFSLWSLISLAPIAIVLFSSYLIKINKNSKLNKQRTINNIVIILESIRDDIYNDPIKVPGTRKFDIEIDNVVDQASEPRKYSFKIDEILGDEINEGKSKDTIEDKSQK